MIHGLTSSWPGCRQYDIMPYKLLYARDDPFTLCYLSHARRVRSEERDPTTLMVIFRHAVSYDGIICSSSDFFTYMEVKGRNASWCIIGIKQDVRRPVKSVADGPVMNAQNNIKYGAKAERIASVPACALPV